MLSRDFLNAVTFSELRDLYQMFFDLKEHDIPFFRLLPDQNSGYLCSLSS